MKKKAWIIFFLIFLNSCNTLSEIRSLNYYYPIRNFEDTYLILDFKKDDYNDKILQNKKFEIIFVNYYLMDEEKILFNTSIRKIGIDSKLREINYRCTNKEIEMILLNDKAYLPNGRPIYDSSDLYFEEYTYMIPIPVGEYKLEIKKLKNRKSSEKSLLDEEYEYLSEEINVYVRKNNSLKLEILEREDGLFLEKSIVENAQFEPCKKNK